MAMTPATAGDRLSLLVVDIAIFLLVTVACYCSLFPSSEAARSPAGGHPPWTPACVPAGTTTWKPPVLLNSSIRPCRNMESTLATSKDGWWVLAGALPAAAGKGVSWK